MSTTPKFDTLIEKYLPEKKKYPITRFKLAKNLRKLKDQEASLKEMVDDLFSQIEDAEEEGDYSLAQHTEEELDEVRDALDDVKEKIKELS